MNYHLHSLNYIFTLIDKKNEVLLCRRSSAGIWGGLYCPPLFESYAGMSAWLDEQGFHIETYQEPQEIHHIFSHFRLLIHVSSAIISSVSAAHIGESGFVWYKDQNFGLPAPIFYGLVALPRRLQSQNQIHGNS